MGLIVVGNRINECRIAPTILTPNGVIINYLLGVIGTENASSRLRGPQ